MATIAIGDIVGLRARGGVISDGSTGATSASGGTGTGPATQVTNLPQIELDDNDQSVTLPFVRNTRLLFHNRGSAAVKVSFTLTDISVLGEDIDVDPFETTIPANSFYLHRLDSALLGDDNNYEIEVTQPDDSDLENTDTVIVSYYIDRD